MYRRPYNKANKPATLICSNPKCDNISSKLYIVEDKIITALKDWLGNYKIDYHSEDIHKRDNISLIKSSIISVQKEIEKSETNLNKIYDFFENGIYNKDEFINRSQYIKENIKSLEIKLEEYNSLLQKNTNMENEKGTLIPKLENVIDLYDRLETAEDKNILLKSILDKVTYLKTEKAIKKTSNPTNFELHIYPKIPKI